MSNSCGRRIVGDSKIAPWFHSISSDPKYILSVVVADISVQHCLYSVVISASAQSRWTWPGSVWQDVILPLSVGTWQ